MRINVFSLLLACLFFSIDLLAQDASALASKETTLVQLSSSLIADDSKTNRIKAEQSFQTSLVEALKIENSFHFPFDGLEAVSILYPSDSTFRIFTWQLYVDKNDYQYGGIIQVNNEKNQIFPLKDASNDIETYDLEYDVLGPSDWYGALYFNLHEFDTPKGKQYLLFGFDGFQFFNKRKIAEALYFDEEGVPVFGAPAFAKAEEGYEASTKNRLYLEYSAEVAARLNYDSNLEIVILDNLVTMRSPYKGVGNVNIPDGSYIGYQLKNGVWEYVEKVFNQVSEKPPAPRRVLTEGSSQKDLFGKKARRKKRNKNLPLRKNR